MHSSTLFNAVFGLIVFSRCSFAIVPSARLPPTFSVSTYAGEATDFPHICRDGGGGGVLNGKNVITFSDTTTKNEAGNMVNFSSNSYAFVPNAKEPTTLQDFGSESRPDVPVEIVPWWGPENCANNSIWPDNSFATKHNDPTETEAYAIYGVGSRHPKLTHLYNTLVSITASDAGLVMERVVPQLWHIDGVEYGGITMTSHSDGHLYLFGNSGSSEVKLAKVRWELAADTSQYKYFTNVTHSRWSTDPTEAAPVLKTVGGASVSSGEVFWSPFYKTWLMVSMTTYTNQFYIQYSKEGHIIGPWSDPVLLYVNNDMACCNSDGSLKYNYAGNAYPYWLGNEVNELVLSWTYGGCETHMALVTFS